MIGTIILTIAQAIFTILFLRIMFPKLSIGEHAFAFRGEVGPYIGMNVGGILLTMITLGIYMPWYMKRILSYLAGETTINGASPSFDGKPGKLLKYIFLALWIPLIVIIVLGVVIGLASLSSDIDTGATSATTLASFVTLVTVFVAFILLIPFMYLLYKWIVDFHWNDLSIQWKTRFWPSCFFVLGQLLLTLITVGIYWPAATVRLFRYFTNATIVTRGEAEFGHLVFDGGIGKGFGLLWGQALLSLITIGIYLPWAYARISRWVFDSTTVDHAEPTPAATV
jgi:uncharacterized membrane protein YjgN (DUF898 family)